MHSTLSDELEALRRSTREMARREFGALAAEVDGGAPIPRRALEQLGRFGAIGLPFPESVGGGGGTVLAWAVVHEELARVMPVLGLYFQVNTIVAAALLDRGVQPHIERWVPGLLDGTVGGCLAFTEPSTGTDTSAFTTVATETADGFRIRGQKMWISNARSAEVALVFANDPSGQLGLFVVPTATPGFNPGAQIPIMGLRGTELVELLLDDLEVGADARIAVGGEAFGLLRRVMSIGKVGMGAMCVGLMETCLEESVRYARARVQQGHPIIDFQAIHHLIAEMVAAVEASRQMVYWAATCRDQGVDAVTELATTKLFVSNQAIKVARMAVSVHGVYGIAQGATIERLFRDAQIFELLEGTSEVQRELVMRATRDIQ